MQYQASSKVMFGKQNLKRLNSVMFHLSQNHNPKNNVVASWNSNPNDNFKKRVFSDREKEKLQEMIVGILAVNLPELIYHSYPEKLSALQPSS